MDSFDMLSETTLFPNTDLDIDRIVSLVEEGAACDEVCLFPDDAFPYELMECGCIPDDDFEDGMDGDHDSAMTSIGWGMDEDY